MTDVSAVRACAYSNVIPGVQMINRDTAVHEGETAIRLALSSLGVVRVNRLQTGVVPASWGYPGTTVCAMISAHNEKCEAVELTATATIHISEAHPEIETLPLYGQVTVSYLETDWDFAVTTDELSGLHVESAGCRPT